MQASQYKDTPKLSMLYSAIILYIRFITFSNKHVHLTKTYLKVLCFQF